MRNLNNQTSIPNSWQMPEGLGRLEAWLERKGVDVHSIKSDRQCLHFVTKLAGVCTKWPARGQSAIPELVRLQKSICPVRQSVSPHTGRQPWRAQPEPFLKSKGAASPVRSVDENILAEITARYGLEPRKVTR
ncbi:hypothetical protein [Ahrensia sp. 13_GOM-1096m]|uniref:hypothetical protein n=1 Tax=Ahrensia sp. 13_GOM-1096m TaxID=1380380 RepID=UPI0004786E62|nr:hypothetical protein [Ahrensia sp. 13_GOM-1096m]